MRHDDLPAGFRIHLGLGEDAPAFVLGLLEMAQQHVRIGHVEIVARIFLLRLAEHVAIRERDRGIGGVEGHLHHVIDPQHIHGEPLEPVGKLARDGAAIMPAHLLEIGELAHLHAVAPHLPAKPPGAERRAFPIVLHEADIMHGHVDADGFERAEIKLLKVLWRRLDDHLILVIVLQAVGIFAVAAVGGAARGLHIGGRPGLRPQRAQGGGGVEGARAHFHVIGLEDGAALPGPVFLQAQDHILEALRSGRLFRLRHLASRSTLKARSP